MWCTAAQNLLGRSPPLQLQYMCCTQLTLLLDADSRLWGVRANQVQLLQSLHEPSHAVPGPRQKVQVLLLWRLNCHTCGLHLQHWCRWEAA